MTQFNKNIGTYAMKFYKINEKKRPSISQVTQGLQQFYQQHAMGNQTNNQKEFIGDLETLFQELISHFNI